jgi:HAE1 family hydrophobic/amphiphilic exporter-1
MMNEIQTDDSGRFASEEVMPRFSLNRRITVLVLLATTMVVGVIATLGIPLELFPRGYTAPSLGVWTAWQQAPSQEMLDKVALPLEEELSTVPGLSEISTVAATGFARCFMSFKIGTDMNVAYREVRDRVERAKARMPDDIDRVLIQKHDVSGFPVFGVGLAIDPAVTNAYDLIQTEIILPLKRIDGVAAIDAQGLEEKEILIELDRERVASAGLNVYELGRELASDNFTLASGHVLSGGKKLMLRSVARYPDIAALENRLVGTSVRLRDVATVRYAEPEKRYRARIGSRPAIALMVSKEGEANAIAVSDALEAAVAKMRQNPRLELIKISPFLNQGEIIRESLRTLLASGAVGGIIAVLVLFFFLRRFRLTLIITLAIPLSVVIGLTAMYFAGETLNILSLLGLMISVGLLVDNSVVVAENIFRLHRQGLSRRQAAIKGAGQISLAVVMATLTTIIVFLPTSLVEGQGQFFLLRLSIPITTSLLGSLLVALVFIPLSVYLTLPAKGGGKTHSKIGDLVRETLRGVYDRTFQPLNNGYRNLLGFFLRRRLDLVLVLVAVCGLTAIPFEEVEQVDVQDEERGFFEIQVELPQNTTMEEAIDYFTVAEEYLEENKDRLDLDDYFVFHRESFGEVQGWFNRPRRNEMSPRLAIEEIQAAMPEKAGSKIYTGLEKDDEEEKKNIHIVTLLGEDSAQLNRLATDLEARFEGLPGVLGVKRSGERQSEEIGLYVDRDRAQRLGISPEVVAGVVRNSLGGRSLPKFYREGREIPVRVRFQEADRESLDELYNFMVPSGTGEAVSLRSITEARRLEAPGRIFRRNKQVARNMTLELEEDREEEAREAVEALTKQIDLPEGVRFGSTHRGLSQQSSENQAMVFAMGLSIIFIYLLMGFLFESFILPLSIVTAIPLAGLGVYWSHYITGYDLDGLGMVGMVLLIGVVVNNGIVLIDYVNRLREEGHGREEALLLATERRFRPIMMTALTTIGGMVPLTISGTTSIGISYTSFGLTLIGGMTTATLLTLLVVPVAYTLFEDLRDGVGALVGRAVGKKSGGVVEAV